jgi:ElaB/YqjD/DUF883 family membrane-anchored ribosome-binding protein
MKNPVSPAVQSLRKEQAAVKDKSANDDLQNAIEDTFPASDPLSITQTSVPSGRTDVDAAEQLENSADLITSKTAVRDDDATRQELRDLSNEITKLSEAIRSVGTSSARLAKAEVRDQVETIEEKVRAQPLLWVSMAAAAGFLWGSVRGR